MFELDFVGGSIGHRRKYGGGKSQLLAKAVGLKSSRKPAVLDLTAGLAKDAFVLAGLGCSVTLLERNPQIFDMVRTALDQAATHDEDPELLSILDRMHIIHADSFQYLQQATELPEVLYLDPMFPERKKNAAVKKDMVALQQIVGEDADCDQLLELALQKARQMAVARVVVKRPRIAPRLADREPQLVFEGKSSRFDVYPLRKLQDS